MNIGTALGGLSLGHGYDTMMFGLNGNPYLAANFWRWDPSPRERDDPLFEKQV